MFDMRRNFPWQLAAVLLALAVRWRPRSPWPPRSSSARPRRALVAPVCPPNVSSAQNCTIVLTRVTAIETLRDGIAYPTKVTKAGRIVAFTVGPLVAVEQQVDAKTYIHFLDQTYGGTAQVAITVLKPVGKHSDFRWQVIGTEQLSST